MNDKSNPDRSCRPSKKRRKAAQFESAAIRGERAVPEARKSRIKDLLALGRHRNVDCFVEDDKLTAVYNRAIIINKSGKRIEVLLFYPIQEPGDFNEGEAWLRNFWPLTAGGANA